MIVKNNYKGSYYAVKYDKSYQSIEEIRSIIGIFDPFHKLVVESEGLSILGIRNLQKDKLFVRINDTVVVDRLGVRVIKRDIVKEVEKQEKIDTPIKLKMKYEKDTGNKIITLSDYASESIIQIKQYINWLEEIVIKDDIKFF